MYYVKSHDSCWAQYSGGMMTKCWHIFQFLALIICLIGTTWMYIPFCCCVYDDDDDDDDDDNDDLYMMGDALHICINQPSASCYAEYSLMVMIIISLYIYIYIYIYFSIYIMLTSIHVTLIRFLLTICKRLAQCSWLLP